MNIKSFSLPDSDRKRFLKNLEIWINTEDIEQPSKEEISIGEYWLTNIKYSLSNDTKRDLEENHLVLVLTNAKDSLTQNILYVEIAVMSFEIEFKSEYDFLLDEKISPYGFPEMVQLWNTYHVPVDNLSTCVGRINDKDLLNGLIELRNKYAFLSSKYLCVSSIRSKLKKMLENNRIRYSHKRNEDFIEFWKRELFSCRYLFEQDKSLRKILCKFLH